MHLLGKLSSTESYFKEPQPGQASFTPRFFTTDLLALFNGNQTLVDIAKTLVDVNDLEANREFLFDLAVSQSQSLAEEGKTFKDGDDSLVNSLSKWRTTSKQRQNNVHLTSTASFL